MVKVKKDLTGCVFGKLTVVGRAEDKVMPNGKCLAQWLCDCDCGTKGYVVPGNYLTSKTPPTISCGCGRNGGLNNNKVNKYDLSGDYGICFLKHGEEVLFDKEDYDVIKQYYWSLSSTGYAVSYYFTRSNEKRIHHMTSFHRLVMNAPDGKDVDHIYGCTLDNRKKNLRICESQQNDCNRGLSVANKTGVSGVCWDNSTNMWRAYITYKRHRYELGHFDDFDDAVRARHQKEKELFGLFSRNVIEGNVDYE